MKHIAMFVEQIGDNFEVIKEIKYNATDKSITYDEHEYPIPTKYVYTFRKKNTIYIFYIIKDNAVALFKKQDLGIDTKMLWRLVKQGVFGQLVSKLRMDMQEKPSNWKIMTTIIMCGMCLLIGYLIGSGGLNF